MHIKHTLQTILLISNLKGYKNDTRLCVRRFLTYLKNKLHKEDEIRHLNKRSYGNATQNILQRLDL